MTFFRMTRQFYVVTFQAEDRRIIKYSIKASAQKRFLIIKELPDTVSRPATTEHHYVPD